MMTSQNARLALALACLLVIQLAAAAFSPAPWSFIWLVLAGGTAFALVRGLRGRPCQACGRLARTRYRLDFADGSHAHLCLDCGSQYAEQADE